ncbi:MAG: hypothetical protein ABIT71_19690 [Vicinamibacteraceae bacterium]
MSSVIALTLAAAACSSSQSPVAPSATSTAAPATAALQGDPSLGPQLAAVRAATAKFHDVNVAMAAGYLNPAGRVCDQIAIGAMGIHSGNFALTATQELDPTRPEVLLYLPKPEGGFRLIGVEYIQFVLLRNTETNVVAPWMSATPWPANYVVVTPTPQLFGQTFEGPMPGHVPGMPWHWDLHAWVWANNPTGVFEQWNPAVSCS